MISVRTVNPSQRNKVKKINSTSKISTQHTKLLYLHSFFIQALHIRKKEQQKEQKHEYVVGVKKIP